jgi:serine/threonine protein kinase
MEFFELGDLSDYMASAPPLPEVEAQEITFQVLEGIRYMHQNEFAHRDLKPGVSSRFPTSYCLDHTSYCLLEYSYQIQTTEPLVD